MLLGLAASSVLAREAKEPAARLSPWLQPYNLSFIQGDLLCDGEEGGQDLCHPEQVADAIETTERGRKVLHKPDL